MLCQLSYTPDNEFRIADFGLRIEIRNPHSAFRNREGWLRGRDLNPRPLGYEPNELPDCSTPRQISTSNSEVKSPKSEIVGGPG